MSYRLGPVPADTPRWQVDEFRKLEQAWSQVVPSVLLDTIYVEPSKKPEGLIVKADGTTWNPNSGSGAYIWRNSAWHLMEGGGALRVNDQSGTTYTLQLTDGVQTLIRMNNASPMTLTIPTNASVAFGVGTNVLIQRLGAGTLTIAGAGGVTTQTASSLTARAQYSIIGIIQGAVNTWLACGDLT